MAHAWCCQCAANRNVANYLFTVCTWAQYVWALQRVLWRFASARHSLQQGWPFHLLSSFDTMSPPGLGMQGVAEIGMQKGNSQGAYGLNLKNHSKLLWGLRAKQWAATFLMTQGRSTEGGGDEWDERGDSKKDCYWERYDRKFNLSLQDKWNPTYCIYYKEFYPKGVIKHEAYMRCVTRHVQGRHETTLINTSE